MPGKYLVHLEIFSILNIFLYCQLLLITHQQLKRHTNKKKCHFFNEGLKDSLSRKYGTNLNKRCFRKVLRRKLHVLRQKWIMSKAVILAFNTFYQVLDWSKHLWNDCFFLVEVRIQLYPLQRDKTLPSKKSVLGMTLNYLVMRLSRLVLELWRVCSISFVAITKVNKTSETSFHIWNL